MRIFFDFEFFKEGDTYKPISVALVAENAQAFYGEFTDNIDKVNDSWIRENVISKLMFKGNNEILEMIPDDLEVTLLMDNTEKIKSDLLKWMEQFDKIEFWGDAIYYDWMLLLELISEEKGIFPKLPNNVVPYPFDIITLLNIYRIDIEIEREKFVGCSYLELKHNSLWDAMVTFACFYKLNESFKEGKNEFTI